MEEGASQEFTKDGMPLFIDTSGEANRKEWNTLYSEIKDLKEKRRRDQDWLEDLEEKIEILYDHNYSWRKKASEETTKEGMPVFIDTSGHLSAEQKSTLFRKIAQLEENDKDMLQWLQDNQKRCQQLHDESMAPKKKWWQPWKR